MFGYVTVYKESMVPGAFDTFRAYYCGLCHATGRECSQISRLGLSYDITFLAVVLASLDDSPDETEEKRCIAHPFRSHTSIVNNRAVDYAASMGVMLGYLKLLDDWNDERSIKARAAMTALSGGVKKARRKYERQYSEICRELTALSRLENENADIDAAADCFAKILEVLFTPDFIENPVSRRVLAWFGYNLGRWIYVMDAFNDLERDFKSKSYNPFLRGENADIAFVKAELREKLPVSLTLNLRTLAAAYELLDIRKNREVLEHIVYASLKARQEQILGENNGSVQGTGRKPG